MLSFFVQLHLVLITNVDYKCLKPFNRVDDFLHALAI